MQGKFAPRGSHEEGHLKGLHAGENFIPAGHMKRPAGHQEGEVVPAEGLPADPHQVDLVALVVILANNVSFQPVELPIACEVAHADAVTGQERADVQVGVDPFASLPVTLLTTSPSDDVTSCPCKGSQTPRTRP